MAEERHPTAEREWLARKMEGIEKRLDALQKRYELQHHNHRAQAIQVEELQARLDALEAKQAKTPNRRSNFTQILQRWSEREPGRCKFEKGEWKVCIQEGNWTSIRYIVRLSGDGAEFKEAAAKLQAAVQAAIEEKGWWWSLQHRCWGRKWLAAVNEQNIRPAEGQSKATAAEALLSVYLDALESNHEHE